MIDINRDELDRAIQNLVAEALIGMTAFAENRMVVSREEKIIWDAMKLRMGANIVDALATARLAITPMRGTFPTSLTVKDLGQFRKEVRVQMEMKPGACFAELRVDDRAMHDRRYWELSGVRELARILFSVMQPQVEQQIVRAIAPHLKGQPS
jgi:hypothetical protein